MPVQAGEPATRPLTCAQLQRAFEANQTESGIVMDLILSMAGEVKESGKLSGDDVYFAE